ncbi:LytR/AlgR family response regulator transcription factor [Metaclostridioides mangenotii]|uniref:LytR/AlgR family response regulator transcription factor n=1 Tax=Metaclostridioides mangenotii TaxID=1540 RepID=UPI0026EFC5E3|nr:LytTR family transcriptional regulator DNA-binding domain-containing protein [Clostridioides mangenotii]
MINIIICNKDLIETLELRDYIKYYFKYTTIKISILEFNNSNKLLEVYAKYYEILFLDIELFNINIVKEIKKKNKEILIILTSEHNRDAIKGYEVNAFRFLQKPFKYVGTGNILHDCLRHIRSQNTNFIINHKNSINIIKLNKILYIEKHKKKIIVNTKNKKILATGNLKDIEDCIAEYNFFKINRGVIINLLKIERIVYSEKYIVINEVKKNVNADGFRWLSEYMKHSNLDKIDK